MTGPPQRFRCIALDAVGTLIFADPLVSAVYSQIGARYGSDQSAEQVKSQYKTLVKRLHPDANNGSRANEDTLKAVIQAYDHLRSSGFC